MPDQTQQAQTVIEELPQQPEPSQQAETAEQCGDVRPKGLRLTIEHELQETAQEALGSQLGAVVALDPTTGAVLAMVSNPGFDPNLLVGANAAPAGDELDNDPLQPLLNRATAAAYPPGSTFKLITASAAFEAGVASTGTPFPNPVELELPGPQA